MARKKVIIEFEGMEFCAAFMAETAPSVIHEYKRNPWVVVEVNDGELEALNSREDIKVFDDIQFEVCPQGWERDNIILMESVLDLDDVLRHIKAEEAWEKARGEDVYIAIVDTGICGTMPEFPNWKKADGWAFDGKPWEDYYGHGSMCACIAAATKAEGGRFNGVAPDAKLYSCKTCLTATELIAIYEWLIEKREEHGKPVIASNSWAAPTCSPPGPCDHPVITIIKQAVEAGITVVFAAGNNHAKCDGEPDACGPNTIWMQNSLDDVLCLGATDEENNLRTYSSRGPGQCAEKHPKPDCVAPTYGVTMWNSGYRNFPNGWGTSGACPQGAGLAALIASIRPDWLPEKVNETIRNNCISLDKSHDCVGNGLIDCRSAIAVAAAEIEKLKKPIKSQTVEQIEVYQKGNKIHIEIELKK